MSESTIDLTEALQRAAAIILTRIQLQTPVKTGELRNSVKVYTQNNEIMVEYNQYGVYTNYGTGPYYNGRYGMGQIAGTFKGYNEGKKGIQAQNWSAISVDDRLQIDKIIETEILWQAQKILDKELKQL